MPTINCHHVKQKFTTHLRSLRCHLPAFTLNIHLPILFTHYGNIVVPAVPVPVPNTQLWHAYLKERRLAVRGFRPDHPALSALCNTYERALVSMHKMPRIWLDYLELLLEMRLVTTTRRAFDRSLAALPITQHDRIWVLYLVSQQLCRVLSKTRFEGFSLYAMQCMCRFSNRGWSCLVLVVFCMVTGELNALHYHCLSVFFTLLMHLCCPAAYHTFSMYHCCLLH